MRYDSLLDADESPLVLDEVLAMERTQSFHATVLMQYAGTLDEYHVEVDATRREWFAWGVTSGRVLEHRDGATYTVDPPREGEWDELLPLPGLTLFFPERMTVWGRRRRDDFRPILVEELGSHSILITVENRHDAAVRGTVVVDKHLGLITSLIRPTDATLIRDVEVGRPIERRQPTTPTPAEYVAPDY